MPPATTPPPTAPPLADPVTAALNDAAVMADLLTHAVARFGRRMPDKPVSSRLDMAQEAVQEVSVRAVAVPSGYDPARGTAVAWLHGVLEKVLSEQCRKVRKQPAQPAADPAAWDGVEAPLTGPNVEAILEPLLSALTPAQQQIITLAYLDELSHAEIAGRLGISRGNARVRLSRALDELKRIAGSGEDSR